MLNSRRFGALRKVPRHFSPPLTFTVRFLWSGGSFIDSIRNLPSRHKEKVAITDNELQRSVTYHELDKFSTALAAKIVESEKERGILSERKAIGGFHKPGLTFTLAMLASWKLNRTFVPLCATHSLNEINYFVEDAGVGSVVCHKTADITTDVAKALGQHLIEGTHVNFDLDSSISTRNMPNDDALVIYTSGTTGRPKGVVHTHDGLCHMVQSVSSAWKYTESDKILHFLPLYHVHGLLNKLLCVLSAGGTVEFLPNAHASHLWERLAQEATNTDLKSNPVTMFMAVPTVYAKMLEHAKSDKLSPVTRADAISVMKGLRLMVSGSAALPDVVMDSWKELTGQVLLERYGMTEIGMALTNPYEPVSARQKGRVGEPFPFIRARLVDEQGKEITDAHTPGELQIAGPTVFKHYLNRPDATAESFVVDDSPERRWFKTGDISERDHNGSYKLLGRASADIIKSAGYKISALEIERELLSHPSILEAAVCATPDPILGESIVAVLSLRPGAPEEAALRKDLDAFLAPRLAKYKQPRDYIVTAAIPRNHMGKVSALAC